jgi:hypothetical protein
MAALIDEDLLLFSGRGDWETDPQLTMDPTGFDSVKATICYRGTGLELFNLYNLGTKNAPGFTSKQLYYTGPRVLEARFGYQIAELNWMGMASDAWEYNLVTVGTGSTLRSLNITMTTEETFWPREGAGGNSTYLLPPYAPPATFGGAPGLRTFTAVAPSGSTIITAQLPWRIRLIGRAWAVSMTGIAYGDRSVIIRPPSCRIPKPVVGGAAPGGTNQQLWYKTGDPLVSWSDENGAADGWVCRNYDLTSELPLGTKILSRWSAHFQWVDRYGP